MTFITHTEINNAIKILEGNDGCKSLLKFLKEECGYGTILHNLNNALAWTIFDREDVIQELEGEDIPVTEYNINLVTSSFSQQSLEENLYMVGMEYIQSIISDNVDEFEYKEDE